MHSTKLKQNCKSIRRLKVFNQANVVTWVISPLEPTYHLSNQNLISNRINMAWFSNSIDGSIADFPGFDVRCDYVDYKIFTFWLEWRENCLWSLRCAVDWWGGEGEGLMPINGIRQMALWGWLDCPHILIHTRTNGRRTYLRASIYPAECYG